MASGTLWGNTVQGVWRCYAKWSTSSTNTTFTMNMTTGMRSLAYGFNIHNLYADSSINNSTNSTNTASFYSATGATVDKDFISKSVTVNRTHSAQTIHAHASVVNNTGFKNGRSDIYTSWTVPAKPSYTVSYNANGGSGAPGNQTKWYGETLTLSSTKPSRTGHSFQGWATSSGGSVAYASGANYTGNAALTLYAVWKANTYAVKYNANGGSGAPGQQTKTYGVTLKLSSTKPTRTNYNFKGWATSATGAVAYQPGANYTANTAVTLYAVWEIAYIKPRITNLSADRCNSAGTLAEDGQYAKVTFNWATDKSVSSIKILCNGVTTTVNASGTSGSVSQVVGANALSTENSYKITVTVTDTMGSADNKTMLAPIAYIIDFKSGGNGMSVGKPCDQSGYLDVAWPTRFLDTSYVTRCESGGGTAGYYKILSIRNEKPYKNSPVYFRIIQRGKMISDVTFYFANNGTATQMAINSTMVIGNASVYGVVNGTTCDIYVKKAETYDAVTITDLRFDPMYQRPEVLFPNQFVTSVPSGYIQFANRVWFDGGGLTNACRTAQNNHIDLANNMAITGKTTSGTASPMLRMNTSNQVELNWTSGGLKGRVMKQIWSGTLSSGKITVSELPYYNVFALEAYVNSAYHKMFTGVITSSRNGISFGVLGGSLGGTEIYALNVEVSGTSFNVTRNTWFNPATGTYPSNAIKIVKIFGVL